jgi:hypothetical protein
LNIPALLDPAVEQTTPHKGQDKEHEELNVADDGFYYFFLHSRNFRPLQW